LKKVLLKSFCILLYKGISIENIAHSRAECDITRRLPMNAHHGETKILHEKLLLFVVLPTVNFG